MNNDTINNAANNTVVQTNPMKPFDVLIPVEYDSEGVAIEPTISEIYTTMAELTDMYDLTSHYNCFIIAMKCFEFFVKENNYDDYYYNDYNYYNHNHHNDYNYYYNNYNYNNNYYNHYNYNNKQLRALLCLNVANLLLNHKIIARSHYWLIVTEDNLFYAGCRGPWTATEALAHWDNDTHGNQERAKLFSAAIKKQMASIDK